MKKILQSIKKIDMIMFILTCLVLIMSYINEYNFEITLIIISILNIIRETIKNSMEKDEHFTYSEKIRKKEGMAEFYHKTHFELLVYKIPEKMSLLGEPIGNEYRDNCEKLQDSIRSLLKKISFYKYIDYDYYSRAREKLIEIEEFIVLEFIINGIDKKYFESDPIEKKLKYKRLENLLGEFYKLSLNYYI